MAPRSLRKANTLTTHTDRTRRAARLDSLAFDQAERVSEWLFFDVAPGTYGRDRPTIIGALSHVASLAYIDARDAEPWH